MANKTPLKIETGEISQFQTGDIIDPQFLPPSIRTLFDYFTNAGNTGIGETDLYSDTVLADTLANDGDKLIVQYSGLLAGDATSTQDIRAYFAGANLIDSGALPVLIADITFDLKITIIRVSNTNIRTIAVLTIGNTFTGAFPVTQVFTGAFSSLDLSGTGYIVKLTGDAQGVSGGSNQIIARLGYVQFVPAA